MIKRLLPIEFESLIQPYRKQLWLVIFFSGCVSLLTGAELICLYFIGMALVSSDITNAKNSFIIEKIFAGYSQQDLLLIGGSIFAVVSVLRLVFQLVNYHFALTWGALAVSRLQSRIMKAILHAPTSLFDKQSPGRIIHGLMEAPMSAMFAIDGVAGLISNLFTALLVGIALIYISPWMILLVVIFGVPTFFLIVNPLQKKLMNVKKRLVSKRTVLTEATSNAIGGIREIKVLCTEKRIVDNFVEVAVASQNDFANSRLIRHVPSPSIQTIFQFFFAVAIIAMASSISGKHFVTLLPQFAVIGYGFLRIYPAVSNVVRSWLEIKNAVPELRVTMEWIDLPEDELRGGTKLSPVNLSGIHFQDVSFSYDGIKPALREVSFDIEAGKTTSLVGGSGAGKSTILDLILKFRNPSSGYILLGDENLNDIIRKDWLDKVGVVQQDIFFLDGTIMANLLESKHDASQEEMIAVCREAGIWDFISQLPKKLNSVIGDRAVTISGGQRQRLAIARALLRNPQVLVLDEAFSALDGEIERMVLRTLKKSLPLRTIIIVSHRLAAVQSSDHVIVLDDGWVVEQGSPGDLAKRNGRYFQLFSSQFGDKIGGTNDMEEKL